MELPAVVVLLALALALGAALGAACAWRPAPEPPPAPAPEPPLPPIPPGLRARFLPPARVAAVAMHEAAGDAEATAQVLASIAADHWSLGVSDLRAALVTHSGLNPALVDHLTTTALGALEGAHGASPVGTLEGSSCRR